MVLEPGEPQDDGVRGTRQHMELQLLRMSIREHKSNRVSGVGHLVQEVTVQGLNLERSREGLKRNVEGFH